MSEPQKDNAELESFELESEMTVQVYTIDDSLIFVGKATPGEKKTVFLSKKDEGTLPPAIFNSEIKLKGYRKAQVIMLYGYICGSTSKFWKVDRLRKVEIQEKRNYFRQRLRADANVMCVDRVPTGDTSQIYTIGNTYPCKVLDISADGILINYDDHHEIGDLLLLMDLKIIPTDDDFTFKCRVKRIVKNVDGANGDSFGCHFEGLGEKEQERLMKAIFFLQANELRSRND